MKALPIQKPVFRVGRSIAGLDQLFSLFLGLAAIAPACLALPGDVLAWGSPPSYAPELLSPPTSTLGRTTAISASNGGHALGLLDDGTVVGWGYDGSVGSRLPATIQGRTRAVAAGGGFGLALLEDSSVVAWGLYAPTITNVPPAARSGVRSIYAGASQALAIRTNGTVVAWGTWGNNSSPASVPEGVSNVVSIAIGRARNAALRTDGTVVTWASSETTPTPAPAHVQGEVVAIAAGADHFLALKQGGTLAAWGADTAGETLIPPAATNVVQIAAMNHVSAALRSEGTAIVWGESASGALHPPRQTTGSLTSISLGSGMMFGLARNTPLSLTTEPASVSVEAGQPAFFTASALGYPQSFQWSRDGFEIPGATAATLALGRARADLAGNYTVTVRNALGSVTHSAPASLTVTPRRPGAAMVWGTNPDISPVPATAHQDVIAVATGPSHALALTESGRTVAWGRNQENQTTVPSSATGVTALAAGGRHSVALRGNGSVVVWGDNEFLQSQVPLGMGFGVTAIAAGGWHTLAIAPGGKVVAWGDNRFGQTSVPTNALANVVEVAAGDYYSAALKRNGTLVVWGNSQVVSIPSTAQSDVIGIVGSPQHLLAQLSDGRVVAWGWNDYGQCDVPPELQSGTSELAAGYDFSASLDRDGHLILWGNTNVTQKLALPAGTVRLRGIHAGSEYLAGIVDLQPPSIGSLSESITFAEGAPAFLQAPSPDLVLQYQWYRNGALLPGATGATLALGPARREHAGSYDLVVSNGLGVARLPRPVQISVTPRPPMAVAVWPAGADEPATVPDAALHDVTSCSVGSAHFLALGVNGGVIAWGSNEYGQSVVPQSATSGVVAIAAGLSHSLALKADGSVIGWGSNEYNESASLPAVGTNITAIAAGGNTSAALRTDGSVVAWGALTLDTRNESQSGRSSPITAISADNGALFALHLDGSATRWTLNPQGRIVASRVTSDSAVAIGGGRERVSWLDATGALWASSFNEQTPQPRQLLGLGIRSFAPVGDGFTALETGGSLRRTEPRAAWAPSNQTTLLARPHDSISFVAGGAAGSAALLPATVPSLAEPLESVNAIEGEPTWLGVDAVGYPLNFQWYHEGVAIPGATGPILARGPAWPGHTGSYTVEVWNHLGRIVSQPARIEVEAAPGGRVVAWADDGSGELPVPIAAQGDVAQVSVGSAHTLALRRTGEVVAWGENSDGQCNVPSAARQGIQAIATGARHSMALTTEGSVLVWGSPMSADNRVPEAAREGILRIAAGYDFCVAQKDDGTLILWGNVADAQTGELPPPIHGVADVVKIAAGTGGFSALRADGSILEWYHGQPAPQVVSRVRRYVDIDRNRTSRNPFRDSWLRADSVVDWQTLENLGWSVYGRFESPKPLRSVAAGTTDFVAVTRDRQILSFEETDWTVPTSARNSVISLHVGESQLVALTVPPQGKPSIVGFEQSLGPVLLDGGDVAFRVSATGGQLHYQWQRDGTNLVDAPGLSGTYSSTLLLTSPSPANSGTYSVIISNALGHVVAVVGSLVQTAPRILQESADAGPWLVAGQVARLRVQAEGGGNEVVWLRDGQPMPGAGTSVEPGTTELVVDTRQDSSDAVYSAEFRNRLGATRSSGFPIRISPWTQVRAADPWLLRAVSVSSDGTSVLAAGWPSLLASIDRGSTWQTVPAPDQSGFTAVAQGDSGIQRFVAREWTDSVFRSIDSGQTWQRIPPLSANVKALACSADGRILVAAGFYTETTGGGMFGFTTYHGRIGISVNGGQSWSRILHPISAGSGPCDAVALSSDGQRIAVAVRLWGYPSYSSNGQLMLSSDQGVTWRSAPLTPIGISSLAMSDDGNHLMVTGDRQAYVSSDFGANWVQAALPERNWSALSMSADGQLIHVASSSNEEQAGVILRSADGGKTWWDAAAPAANWRQLSSSADGTTLMAVATEGIFRAPSLAPSRGTGLLGEAHLQTVRDSLGFENGPSLDFAGVNDALVGDCNGDGLPDIVAFASGNRTARVWLRTADGGLRPAADAPFTTGSGTYGRRLQDVDGDGRPDLVAGHFNDSVAVQYGDGTGRFEAPTSLPILEYEALVVADFNGDRIPDLGFSSYWEDNQFTVILGDGHRGFSQPILSTVFRDMPAVGLSALDLNGDGHLDVVGGVVYSDRASVMYGRGDGTFGATVSTRAGTDSVVANVHFTDLSADGLPDFLSFTSISDRIHVWHLERDGNFHRNPGSPLFSGPRPTAVNAGDVDGDGKVDLVVRCGTGQLRIFLGSGNEVFDAVPPLTVTMDPSKPVLAVADLNGDGRLDLLTRAADSGSLQVQFNPGLKPRHVLELSWEGVPGRAYPLYSTESLTGGPWQFQGWVVADTAGRIHASPETSTDARYWKID